MNYKFGKSVGKEPFNVKCGNSYSFLNPTEGTLYFQILNYIYKNNGATRKEINNAFEFLPSHTVGDPNPPARISNSCNNMFAQMRYAGLIQYNKATHIWAVGPNFENYKKMFKDLFN